MRTCYEQLTLVLPPGLRPPAPLSPGPRGGWGGRPGAAPGGRCSACHPSWQSWPVFSSRAGRTVDRIERSGYRDTVSRVTLSREHQHGACHGTVTGRHTGWCWARQWMLSPPTLHTAARHDVTCDKREDFGGKTLPILTVSRNIIPIIFLIRKMFIDFWSAEKQSLIRGGGFLLTWPSLLPASSAAARTHLPATAQGALCAVPFKWGVSNG